jgi:ribosome recycling factor
MTNLSNEIKKAVQYLQKEFVNLQTGAANVGIVDDIEVECYGAMTPLKAVANVSCPDAMTIKIEPWDKSTLGDIEKALQQSNIGINPQNMGESILLPIPPMTEERRKEIAKQAHGIFENSRISIRNIRHHEMTIIKKEKDNKEISEDEFSSAEKEVQKLIDEGNKEIETLFKSKEKEILSI